MKKSFFTLILTLLVAFMSPNLASAFEINIGGHEGSDYSYYAPFCNYYRYSYAQTIYPGDQIISTDCDITSIAWEMAGTASLTCSSVKIYLGYASDERFSSATWIPASQLTCVYSHTNVTIGGTANTWQTFQLDSPFHYQGGRNLVVAVAKEASSYNSSLTFYEYNATNTSLYRQSDSYTYYADCNDNTAGSLRNYRPKINLNVEVSGGSSLTIVPDPMDLGPRANGVWNRPFMAALNNMGAPTTINGIDTENPFFMVQDMTYPFTIGMQTEQEFLIETGEATGDQTGRLVVSYDDSRTVIMADMTAFAYDPVCPDVWELARNVSSFPYSETITPASQSIYNNYLLPGNKEDGPDAVFKLTFNEDVLLNADVEGDNGKIAFYQPGFGGQGGPGADNYYGGTSVDNLREYVYFIGNDENGTQNTVGRFDTSDPLGTVEYFGAVPSSVSSEHLYGGLKQGDNLYLICFSSDMLYKFNINNLSTPLSSTYMSSYYTLATNPVNGKTYMPSSSAFYEVDLETGAQTYAFAHDASDNFSAGICFTEEGRCYGIKSTGHDSWFGEIDMNTGHWTVLQTLPDFNTSGTIRGLGYSMKYHTFYATSAGTSMSSRRFMMIDPDLGITQTYYVPDRWFEILGVELEDVSREDDYISVGGDFPISNITVPAGTYYLAASSTADSFTVNINPETLPCPEQAINPSPADDADGIAPASVVLNWEFANYTTEYRLVFGSTYYCEETLVDWTTDLATSYTVTDLFNNTNYFWRVDTRNSECETLGQVWGFTTTFNAPTNLHATNTNGANIYEGEALNLAWTAIQDRTFRQYNIYQNGELIGSTPLNSNTTTYTVNGLDYDMYGYMFYVTAVYDEGESGPSNELYVHVSGNGRVAGHVYEQDGVTGIAGATVTFNGTDEFGRTRSYDFITDATGAYGGDLLSGEYDGKAECSGYQPVNAPVCGNPVDFTYAQTTSPVDFVMNEVYTPVGEVIAEYYPDPEDPESPYVKVYWGWNIMSAMIEDFETGDFSQYDWNIPAQYPFEITTNNPYEGAYCMQSTNHNVASSTSSIDVTVEIPRDGLMSFYKRISCESSWDMAYFYIDGAQVATFTGTSGWGVKEVAITEGTHNFKWAYTKDSSVDSGEDRFFIDYIDFIHDAQPAQPGWHTYCEGEFDNALGSNLTTTPSWGYMYPNGGGYAGMRLTKVALFSDSQYTAVGGNYTCTIYTGGATPAEGTPVSTMTVDVPSGQNAWVEFDLSTPVAVSGNENLWVIWTANTCVSSWPAGLAAGSEANGSWWNGGESWEQMVDSYGVFTMKNYFTNRSGRTVEATYATAETSDMYENHPVQVAPFAQATGNHVENAITVANPNLERVATANANDRSFQYFRVYRTDCYNDGPYTLENTTVVCCELHDTLYIDVEWPELAPGVYKWGVGCVYGGNRGELVESPITWATVENNTRAEAITYDFEDGTMGDWTTIDADGDGINWIPSTDLSLAGYGHNGSQNFVLSQSYSNSYGALHPDNYLVSPQIQLGGSITFYASAQDENWSAEHFAVAVSTTGNTNASDFTTVQEWTLTSKGTRHDGERGLRQGSWHEYTVDLSAYSGLGYVALRHFNTTDMFYIDVDDITLVPGQGGPTPDPIQEPRESQIVWSNCLDKDMNLGEGAVTVTVLLNSADSPEGTTVSFRNLNEAEQELYPVAPVVLDESGYYAWDSFRRGEYEVNVALDGYETITGEVSIQDATDLRYVLVEILYGVNNLYVSHTGWAMWDGEEPGPVPPHGGSSFEYNFDGTSLEDWTLIDANNDGLNWMHSHDYLYNYDNFGHNDSYGFLLSESYDNNALMAVTPDNYVVSPQVNFANGSTFTFWATCEEYWGPEHMGVAISTSGNTNAADFTTIAEWTLGAKGNGQAADSEYRTVKTTGRELGGVWYEYSVDLSAYAGQTGYIAIRHFNCSNSLFLCVDDCVLTAGAKNEGERHLEGYKVLCTSIDGEPIFSGNTVHPFIQLPTETLIEGERYLCKVMAIYSSGFSAWSQVEWQYRACENYEGVQSLDGETGNDGNEITWTYPNGSPIPPHGDGDEFTVDFEGGLPTGWNVIDGNNDGATWCLTSAVPTTWTYYASLTLDWYRNGTNAICSGSYINGIGAVNPDEYLVSPQVTLVNGSQLSFWAAATDASYPADHFGVFVSDNGTSDWTMVNEWTLTAKGNYKAGDRASRDGEGLRLGTWYNYTVDLSAFAGQKYIAIRHFNCYDQYIMCVDDIELTAGAKGGRAMWDLMGSMNAYEAAQYGVATDGTNIYTCNWGYSSATYNFCKYDMQGNFIEGFNINGCGTIRDLDYDGQYFYGGANSSTLYCMDLANHTLVSTINTGCGAIRHCSYDPQNDGFWVGGWDDLMLVNRNGQVVTTAPAPTSCGGSGYYEDENGNGHVYLWCEPQSVYDYDINANTINFINNLTNVPGWDGSSTAGGAFVGEYNGKIAFFCDIQQDPNVIGIYELRDSGTPTPPPGPVGNFVGAMIFRDGEWLAQVDGNTTSYIDEDEYGTHEYCVRVIYDGPANLPDNNEYYSMSCPTCVIINGDITCEPGDPIRGEYVWNNAEDFGALISWGAVTPGPGDEFTEGFESGSIPAGWTTIDADGDGFNWTPASVWMAGYIIPSHSGADCITSASYYNYALTPDNYLVSPQVAITNGSTFSFWACAQDPSYAAEHYGVAISTTGNTNAADFTTIAEWTMTAKDAAEAGAYMSKNGRGTREGNWYQKTVDLSAYAGQQVYIAIRHFNCTDMFYLNVDDAELAINAKGNRAGELVKYNVYRSSDNVTYELIGSVDAIDGTNYYEYYDATAAGLYYYQVRALYSNGCESEPAASEANPANNYVIVVVTSVAENGEIALYPNPTNGNITIQAQNMNRITVVSVLGQVVYDAEVEGDEYHINMAQFNAGVYMVRIATENGVSTQRVTVVK